MMADALPPVDVLTSLVTQRMYDMVHEERDDGSRLWPELVAAPPADYRIEILDVAPLRGRTGNDEADGGYLARCTVRGHPPSLSVGEYMRATEQRLAMINANERLRERKPIKDGWHLASFAGGPVGHEVPSDVPADQVPMEWAPPQYWIGGPRGSVLMGGVRRTDRAGTLRIAISGDHVFESRFNEHGAALIFAAIPGGLNGMVEEIVSIIDVEGRPLQVMRNSHDCTIPSAAPTPPET